MRLRNVIAISSVLLLGALVGIASAAPTERAGATPIAPEPGAHQVLVDRMVELGLTPVEASARLDKLTFDDLQALSAHPEQLAMGGVKDRTLIIIAGIIILPTILIILLA